MDLMQAWDRLRPANAVLLVAGPDMTDHPWNEGPAAREFVERHNLSASVRFLGSIADVAPLLRAADVVIQPSHFEALGLSAVEALASGVPVVASAVGGLLDFVDRRRQRHAVSAAGSGRAGRLPSARSSTDDGVQAARVRPGARVRRRPVRRAEGVRAVRASCFAMSRQRRPACMMRSALRARLPFLVDSGYATLTAGSAALLLVLLTIAGAISLRGRLRAILGTRSR